MSRSSRALLPASLIALTLLANRLVPGGSGDTPTGASPSALPKQLQYVLMEQTAAGTLREPLGLALAPDGSVFVADTENHRVQHFSADGAFLTMWGRYGSGEAQFDFPRIVAVGPLGTTGTVGVFVLDGEDRIQRFSMAGRYLGVVSAAPLAQDSKSVRVEGMAVGSDGALYLASAERLMRVAPSGAADWTLQPLAAGKAAGDLGPPLVLADGRVVLCDQTAARVIFVSAGGTQLADWGEKGTTEGMLRNPLKVLPVAGDAGQLWVWEPADVRVANPPVERIHRFTVAGGWLETKVLPELMFASDLAMEASGRLRALLGATILLAQGDGSVLSRTGAGAMIALGDPEQISMAPDGSLYIVQPSQFTTKSGAPLAFRQGPADQVLHLDVDGRALPPLGATDITNVWSNRPARLTFEQDGDLLVSYPSERSIHRFTADGSWQGKVPTTADGVPDSDQWYPTAMVVGRQQETYVINGGFGNIKVYDAGWQLLRTLYHPFLRSTDPSLPSAWTPTALALAADDSLFVIDHQSGGFQDYYEPFKSVVHLGADGALLRRFGAVGSDFDRLFDARDISLGPDGSLVIADHGNDRIQRFGQDGRWIDQLDLRKAPAGALGRPRSAIWTAADRMFVANASPPSVQVFAAKASDVWRVEVFDNAWLTGWPKAVSSLPDAIADWGDGPLAAGLAADGSSALLSRNLWLAKGRYRVRLQATGGARLWLGERLVQESWEQPASDWTESFVVGGPVFVRLAFRDLAGPASLKLSFEPVELMTEAPTAEATAMQPSTGTPSPWPSVTFAPPPRVVSVFLPLVGPSLTLQAAGGSPVPTDPPTPTPTSSPPLNWLASVAPAEPAFGPHPDIDVESYDLRLDVPRLGDPIRATLVLTLTARQALSVIDLDAEPSSVHVARVSSAGQSLLHQLVLGKAPNPELSGTRLRIHPPHALNAGDRQVLRIDYVITYPVINGTVPSKGFSMFDGYYGSPLLETLSWPYRTRFWLPSNDHPSDPATIRLELHVPPGMIGAAVGRLVDGDYLKGSGPDAQGLTVFRWALDQAVPTYGYNIVVGNLDVYQEDVCFDIETINTTRLPCDQASHRVPIVRFIGRGKALNQTYLRLERDHGAKALILLSSMLGPYEFPKLGLSDQPHPFAMEYPSLIANGPYIDTHELVHSWWGDSVLIETWGDFWISEGFTTYFTGLVTEYLDGGLADFSSTEGRLVESAQWDPVYGIGGPAYSKGAAAIGDLRKRIADLSGLAVDDPQARDLFFTVMRAVYQEFRFKPLGSQRLFAFLRERLGGLLAAGGHPVTAADINVQMDAWELAWTSYDTTLLIAESGNKYGEAEVLMGQGSPPLSSVAQPLPPLAWYGLACGDDAPIQPVQDKLALIERGGCTFSEKLGQANAHGAIGVVIFTDNRTKIAPNAALGLTGMIDREPGLVIRDRLLAGEEVTVTFKDVRLDLQGRPLP